MNPVDRTALAKQLCTDEGVRTKAYKDTVGKLTIGVGRNLDDRGVRLNEIELMLQNDIDDAISVLNTNTPWWKSMSSARQQVLANMCFNMGWLRLSGFKKMLAAAKAGQFDTAAVEMLDSKWASQVGNRAIRLSKMMREG